MHQRPSTLALAFALAPYSFGRTQSLPRRRFRNDAPTAGTGSATKQAENLVTLLPNLEGELQFATKCAIATMSLLLVCYRRLLAPALLLFGTMPSCCRFLPSCSEYAQEAVRQHGWKGFFLALRRLSRCRPLLFTTPREQGIRFDPVSPAQDEEAR